MRAREGRTFLPGGADSCCNHLLPCPCPVPSPPLRWTDESITKGPGEQRNCSPYRLGPEAHGSILQLVKVRLFIWDDQHISPTGTYTVSPSHFLLLPSFYTPFSFLLIGKWENCPWLDSVFQRIQFSFVHTWSDPVTDIKCVFCLMEACVLCADGHSPLSHMSASTNTCKHTQKHT